MPKVRGAVYLYRQEPSVTRGILLDYNISTRAGKKKTRGSRAGLGSLRLGSDMLTSLNEPKPSLLLWLAQTTSGAEPERADAMLLYYYIIMFLIYFLFLLLDFLYMFFILYIMKIYNLCYK